MNKNLKFVGIYGKNYVQLGGDTMDELCIWIREMCKRFRQEGKAIFEKNVPEVLDLTDITFSVAHFCIV